MESVKDAKKVMETQEYVDAVPEVPPDHKDQAMNVQIGSASSFHGCWS